MKKLKYLFVLLMLLVVPFMVYAEGEEGEATTESDKEVNVYFFRGEGCSHCAEAEAWFESIEEEYGDYFKIVDYETWYNDDNAELMQKVASARNEEANGVPYIIIGNKSWNGFTESYEEEMISEIKSEYEKNIEDRYDVMKLLSGVITKDDKSNNDVLALIIIVVIVGGVCFGVYKARNNTN